MYALWVLGFGVFRMPQTEKLKKTTPSMALSNKLSSSHEMELYHWEH